MTPLEQATTNGSPLVNRIMARLLSSPLSWLVDRSVLLLTVEGRRTGRFYTFPVQYVHDGGVLWVYVGDEAAKTWWRNLVGGALVRVLLGRRIRAGTSIAVRRADEPELVERGLRQYGQRFPRTAKRLGISTDAPPSPGEEASGTVMVRIELTAEGDDGGRSVDRSAGEETARR